ncbi:hypothetical protein L211DRAFT_844049, partial [Terfezia boudieri ATCC MYA-4762]
RMHNGGWVKVGNACTAWRGLGVHCNPCVLLACWALGRMEVGNCGGLLVCDKHLKPSLEGEFIFGYKIFLLICYSGCTST